MVKIGSEVQGFISEKNVLLLLKTFWDKSEQKKRFTFTFNKNSAT